MPGFLLSFALIGPAISFVSKMIWTIPPRQVALRRQSEKEMDLKCGVGFGPDGMLCDGFYLYRDDGKYEACAFSDEAGPTDGGDTGE